MILSLSLYICTYIYIYRVIKTANKKKLQFGSIQADKFIAEIPEKREIKTQVQFRHGILESQKRVNYQSEFDRLQGAKRLRNCIKS